MSERKRTDGVNWRLDNYGVYVDDDPKKGKILRCARPLKAGEIGLEDKPVIVATQTENDVLEQVIEDMYKRKSVNFELAAWLFRCAFAYASGADEVRAVVDSLFCPEEGPQFHEDAREVLEDPRIQHLVPKGFDTETLIRVMITANANAYSHDGNAEAVALYKYAPRISHSCSPNSVWDSEGGSYVLRLVKDLDKDEELTICYARTSFRSTPRRRAHLKLIKSFDCVCERCSAPDNTRGYLCRACKRGTVFIQTDEAKVHELEKCDACGRPIDVKLKETLVEEEERLAEMLESELDEINDYSDVRDQILKAVTEKVCRKVIRACHKSLATQHWVLSFAHERLSDQLLERDAYGAAGQHLAEACWYMETVCPFVNTTIAWTLESIGDNLLGGLDGSLYPGMRGDDSIIPSDEKTAERVRAETEEDEEAPLSKENAALLLAATPLPSSAGASNGEEAANGSADAPASSGKRGKKRAAESASEGETASGSSAYYAKGDPAIASHRLSYTYIRLLEMRPILRAQKQGRAAEIFLISHLYRRALAMNRVMNPVGHGDITGLERKLTALERLFPGWLAPEIASAEEAIAQPHQPQKRRRKT